MDSETHLRKAVHALIASGVTQRAIAAHLDVSTAWFSRWLRGESGAMDLPTMDRFYAYVEHHGKVVTKILRSRPFHDIS
jgi:predicted transcriptional regulator